MKFNSMSPAELDAYWKGVEDEQDRIIKLLENDMCSCILADCQVAQAIALIKGEK